MVSLPQFLIRTNFHTCVGRKMIFFLCLQKYSEVDTQSCSYEKVFWKYAANWQLNTHAEVWFQ